MRFPGTSQFVAWGVRVWGVGRLLLPLLHLHLRLLHLHQEGVSVLEVEALLLSLEVVLPGLSFLGHRIAIKESEVRQEGRCGLSPWLGRWQGRLGGLHPSHALLRG